MPDLLALPPTRSWFVTDDQGTVCPRDSLNYVSGCCREGQQHSCDSCALDDRCCSEYERCVSCCMKPEHMPEAQLQHAYRGLNK